ncbi:MAG: hypothetical protein DHS20C15_03850 [Planctomycetota bacterium]|nr:MAG: hypothetical protein DHS20C15_03850 [Planctomycetota bacterium]
MIDMQADTLVHLREVPDLLPRRRGRKVHLSTVYRWTDRGVGGTKLETLKVGGVAYTSQEALARFIANLSGETQTTTSHAPSRHDLRAARELDEDGIG